MQIVSKLWLCSNTFLNCDCVIYFQLSDKSIQSLFPSSPHVFPISAHFHWHLLCAPGSSRVVRQALSPALSWAQWDASLMEAWRSYCNANCIFPPSASPLLLVGGWRWHHMVQGLSCLEIKQLHRLAQKGRVICSCKNIYKCRVQFEIERKQQTLSGGVYFSFLNCELKSLHSLCELHTSFHGVVLKGPLCPHVWEATLLRAYSSWLKSTLSYLSRCFITVPIYFWPGFHALPVFSPGNNTFVFSKSTTQGRRARLLCLLVCFSWTIHHNWTKIGGFGGEWFFGSDNLSNMLQLSFSV